MSVLRSIAVIFIVFSGSALHAQDSNIVQLSEEELYDKVLGSIVGSAMGDAMGASTEMWPREEREAKYGYITNLTAPEITPSAEGVWDAGYPAGATTDDTRWKQLAGTFLSKNIAAFYEEAGPAPILFADHILEHYKTELEKLESVKAEDKELAQRKADWIIEWADVSKAYKTGDIDTYNKVLAKFYGGYQLTAGILYGPMMALPYPGNPEKAYLSAFRLAIFDQGYARDMTALSAAMTAEAMSTGATKESILAIFENTDPHGFKERRIFSREALETLKRAQGIISQSQDRAEVWKQLDANLQEVSPHAQEILFLTLAAMIYSDFEFQETIEFLVNYGRDNDTTSALAGSVLGAFHGFEQLPEYKIVVMEVARDVHGINLQELAESITKKILSQ